MKKVLRFTAPVIALALMSIAPAYVRAQATTNNNQTQNATTEDWSNPPAGSEQAQAYHDGIQALQLDTAAKRKIDAQSSYLYLHPPVKGAAKDQYRASFVAGYQAAMKHKAQGGA